MATTTMPSPGFLAAAADYTPAPSPMPAGGGSVLADFRKAHPEYQQVSDHQLADGLYHKFYADKMDQGAFYDRIGLKPMKLAGKVAPKSDTAAPEQSSNVSWAPGQGPQGDGVPMNVAAGINRTLLDMTGGVVDRARNVLNWGVAGVNALTGQPLTTNMIRNAVGDSNSIAALAEKVGIRDPRTVQAVTPAEKLAAGAGAGIGAVVFPEMALATGAKLGAVSPRVAETLAPLLGDANSMRGMAANAVAGAAGGAGASAGEQLAPEPYKGLAAMIGGLAGAGAGAGAVMAPRAAREAVRMAGDYVAPVTEAGRQRLAGEALYQGASDPQAAIAALNKPGEIVRGSVPTTFQQTGDLGLGAMERGAAAKNPAEFARVREQQNLARRDQLAKVGGAGSPEAVVGVLRDRLASIDQQTAEAVAAATRSAQEAASAVGQGIAPDVAGERLRAALQAARDTAKSQERALWKAVDPNGTLALAATETKSAAKQIAGEMPAMAKPMDAEEGAIFAAVGKLPANAPLSELTALQSRVKTAMRVERIANGESPAYARLSRLNAAVQADLEGAIATRVAQEQQAVAAGQMKAEDTFAAYLLRQREAWFAERASRATESGNLGPSAFRDGGVGSAAVSGVRRAAGESGSGLSGAPGSSGIQANSRGIGSQGAADALGLGQVDPAALDRLSAARAATRNRAQTFDNGTLGPMLQRPSTVSPYDIPVSSVAPRLFAGGPRSLDAIRAYRAAVGDQVAFDGLTGYAIDRLRRVALREDGTLDPAKVATWRRQHSDALRAFPELEARIQQAASSSEALAAEVAARKAAIEAEQLGAAGKLLGLETPEDVVSVVGGILSRQDAATEMMRLRFKIGKNQEALQGLKRAVADFMSRRLISNTEVGASGVTGINSDAFQQFVRTRRGALKAAGFTESDLATLEAIATDLQRANRSTAGVRIPGGSNTAQDTLAAKATDKTSTILGRVLVSLAAGGGAGAVSGVVPGIAIGAGTAVLAALRENGLQRVDQLVTEALLNPEVARLLLMKVKPGKEQIVERGFVDLFRRAMVGTLGAQDFSGKVN